MTRVLQVHNHHAALGGAMEVLEHERELLLGAGHQVEQFTLAATKDLGLSAVRAGAKAIWNAEAARDLTRQIHGFGAEVVHVHTPFPLLSPAVFRAAYAAGVPSVGTLHSFRYSCIDGVHVRAGRICTDCVGSRLKLAGVRHRCYHDSALASGALTVSLGLHRAIGTFDRAVTRYITLTDFTREVMIRDGYPADRLVVKPNSIPDPGVGEHRPVRGREVFFAGRLIDLKGVRTMLAAWRGVHPGMRLVIAGDGELREVVEEFAAGDDSVDFLGWISEDEVFARMRAAEVVLMPSEWFEGNPLVLLRSLAVGTPVLVSDLDNFADFVRTDGTGWTFTTRDPVSLRAALNQIVADPERAPALRARARASYERRFSPAVNLAALERIYDEVCAGPLS